MAKKIIILEHKNGHVEEMRDHTEWFVDQFGETGAQGYFQTIINAAIKRAGEIKNIKRLARWNGNIIVEDFVLHGYNMLKLKNEVGEIDSKSLAKLVAEFVEEIMNFKPSDGICDLFAKAVFGEITA